MKNIIVIFWSLIAYATASAQVVGDWPPNSGYSYFGVPTLNQSWSGNYALLQDKNNGLTFLNSPLEIRFRINNNDRMFLSNSGNLGIGTTSPGSKLEVHGTAAIGQYTNGTAVIDAFNSYAYFGCNSPTNGLSVGPNGYVGIGGVPGNKLTVVGSQSAEDIVVNVTNYVDQDFNVRLSQTGAAVKRTIIGPSTTNRLSLGVGIGSGNEYLTVINGGNVGIGTTSPNQKLTVNGTIYGKQVKVDLSVPGPDYVFEKSYSLPSLEVVKSFIDEHKHLPEIPSAKEMEEKGINVGEMNMLLLKKVEELTLYVIEQEKRITTLEAKVKN